MDITIKELEERMIKNERGIMQIIDKLKKIEEILKTIKTIKTIIGERND